MWQVVNEYVEESGYVSKAPLYPVQYDMRIPGTFTFIEHILTFSFTFTVILSWILIYGGKFRVSISNLDQFLVNVRVTIFVYLLITLLSGHSENIEHYRDNDYNICVFVNNPFVRTQREYRALQRQRLHRTHPWWWEERLAGTTD